MAASHLKILITGFLLSAVLILSIAVPAAAGGAQNWYLDSLNHSVTGKLMEKVRGIQTGEIPVPAGETAYWLADQVAQADVTYPSGSWVIGLKTDGYWGGTTSDKAILVVGEWDTAKHKFIAFSTSNQPNILWDDGKNVYSLELQTGSETVHTGNYLALQITNQDMVEHTIVTDGSSFLESPSSDPGYPLPELATLGLLGLGLVGLVGYIGIVRLKSRPKA
jgi:hypothetical protein